MDRKNWKHAAAVWEIRVLGGLTVANPASDTDQLLIRAAAGDRSARGQLLERHRKKLQRMVALRLDRRLAARVDPSDVVQEALADAARRLDDYLRERPLPYYPWLRRLAWDRLDKAHRRHTAGRRSVGREEPPTLPDESALKLAERLLAPDTDPARAALRKERRQRVRALLERLAAGDREVLVLRFLERLSTDEAAAVLGISPGAIRLRLMRALERLRQYLGDDLRGEEAS
jgi:RNA polymerase sigma-70 factor (ECF subfamily)